MKFVKNLRTGDILELPDMIADILIRDSMSCIELSRWRALAQLILKQNNKRRKRNEL